MIIVASPVRIACFDMVRPIKIYAMLSLLCLLTLIINVGTQWQYFVGEWSQTIVWIRVHHKGCLGYIPFTVCLKYAKVIKIQVIHGVKRASSLLVHRYGVRMQNVFDTQVSSKYQKCKKCQKWAAHSIGCPFDHSAYKIQ